MAENEKTNAENISKVEGVGKLSWAVLGKATAQDCEGQPVLASPKEFGYILELILDKPFRCEGLEYYISYAPRTKSVDDHTSLDSHGNIDSPKFPTWFIRFIKDMHDWTKAAMVYGWDDSETAELHKEIEISVDPGPESPAIKNARVFLGTLAAHMAKLASEPV